jgi:SAM-dependent methyltransferase
MFAFKWGQRASYGGDATSDAQRAWLLERYGDIGSPLRNDALVLDAGCGAGFAADLLFGRNLERLRYVGVDLSASIDIARERLAARTPNAFFIQGDILKLPFAPESFDLVLSEGVLHHTPSTRDALCALTNLVKPGGQIAFYVYAEKGPVREFTDDFIRGIVANMSPEEAWKALMPLTALGKALGDLGAEIEVPDEIDFLGIPKGRISVQRLFYYYVCKAYHRPEYTLEEMNHINFDWFTPHYCHRQRPEEVAEWCRDVGLEIEMLKTELSGITAIATKPAR